MPDTVITVSRRSAVRGATLLGGAAVAATVAGCQWGPPTSVAAPAAKRDADATTVDQLTTAIAAQAQLVADTATRHVGLATTLAPLTAMHRAHLAVLTKDPVTAAAVAVAPSPDAALSAVRRGEATLQRSLTAGAQGAASGPLARAIASMAAGVAMHLAAAPTPKGGAA
ncbi:hypothetical protein [Nocardioides jiangxiensis]|uniref:DUF4439 domain-containing protein n=1 Tax=Nocardioides jiangxiensis TaxID=3064524 RepID=A0ABT9B301_9ACTN|nr:hypothetical protein [Nocardioides sp. WY-20]MDO7869232.1 hypothetical protein [Nocardioides sp. WY-20]